MTESKNWLTRYWQILTVVVMVAFNMGYTIKEISGKTDRVEVQTMIDNKIKDHVDETKDQYIKIDQVPGLQERLKSIEDGLQDNKEMTQKIYDKLMKLK